ncbi:MAG: hypothetical protein HY648_09300 [Acidobacteria bacterium]|nr:hypothetical protein [Acidobacteriota bacterium]
MSSASKRADQRPAAEPGTTKGAQKLAAPQAEILFRPDGKTLRQIQTQARSKLELSPAEASQERWTVEGANFRMDFDGQGALSEFSAEQGVRTTAEVSKDPTRRRIFVSESLRATYSPRTGSLEQIEQWGKFRYEDAGRRAQADRAEYRKGGDEIVLQGNAAVWEAGGKVVSERMVWNTRTDQMTAEGKVAATYLPSPSPGTPPPEPVQIVSERLQYAGATGRSQHQGKVRLWQGTSLLESDWVEMDRRQEQLLARGNVYSVFQQSQDGAKKREEPLVVRSNSLLYRQDDRKARYEGNVRMESASVDLRAAALEVIGLRAQRESAQGRGGPSSAPTSAPGGEQMEQAIAMGGVQILDGERKATASRAEYFPAQGEIRLFGEPAVVEDPQHGVTQGARLTYRVADASIAVDGKPGLPAETRRQVLR